MRVLPLALIPLALHAAAPAAPRPAPNPFNDRLRALSPVLRDGTLRRAVTNAGLRCGRLDQAVDRGPWGNLGMWTARCTPPAARYGIFIGPDGTAQVRPCADLAALKLPTCEAARRR